MVSYHTGNMFASEMCSQRSRYCYLDSAWRQKCEGEQYNSQLLFGILDGSDNSRSHLTDPWTDGRRQDNFSPRKISWIDSNVFEDRAPPPFTSFVYHEFALIGFPTLSFELSRSSYSIEAAVGLSPSRCSFLRLPGVHVDYWQAWKCGTRSDSFED